MILTWHILVRVSILLCLSSGLSFACSCSPPITAWVASINADVVFRGTVTALRDVEEVSPNGTRYKRKIAVFRVNRYWKGGVGPTFEMTAPEEFEPCMGPEPSQFKVGNDLLVYAKGSPKLGYNISACSRTWLARDAKSDFNELGPGEEPKQVSKPNSKYPTAAG